MELKSKEIIANVTEDMLAINMKSGSLRVLATPAVVALMENASSLLAQEIVDDGITTVGTFISIEHLSPSPIGAEIKVVATLKKQENRMFVFDLEAYDNSGLIAKGTHNRFSVKSESFQKKADEKFTQ